MKLLDQTGINFARNRYYWITMTEPGFEYLATKMWWYPKPQKWYGVGGGGYFTFQVKKGIRSFQKPGCNPNDRSQAKGILQCHKRKEISFLIIRSLNLKPRFNA